ncbi:hypothetical protein PROFUN_04505 [Planoprotostelium fungivorum]|uniref:Peptidase S53 domain-containing protein n=1 Tax=Planoprotostelium fungivorum TaxID=1890364 RepID=A0A2P6NBE3_9EUKA|nr:hypothetical protein PROFUN_04505 [Planoprotostelium fungivorum]
MKTILLLLCLSLIVVDGETDLALVARRDGTPHGWTEAATPSPSEHIRWTIHLKQNNLEQLEKLFWAVSDPDNKKYGHYLTVKQLQDLVTPSPSSFEMVEAWLDRHGISYVRNMDSIEVSSSVEMASNVLDAEFRIHKHVNGMEVIRSNQMSLPPHLHSVIDIITGITDLFSIKPNVFVRESEDEDGDGDDDEDQEVIDPTVVTPHLLRHWYGIPNDLAGNNSLNSQGLFAFNDYYSAGALQKFTENFSLPEPIVYASGKNCFPYCNEAESDLDVQYMSAMGRGVPIFFSSLEPGQWMLTAAENVLKGERLPYVVSISYGYSELSQCLPASGECQALGYDSKKYVDRTNVAFQKLGVLGVSVLVADGAVSGNCPADSKRFCPTGNCRVNQTVCPAVTVTRVNLTSPCHLPMGLRTASCDAIYNYTSMNPFNDAAKHFVEKNAKCDVIFDVRYTVLPSFFASNCSCKDIETTTHGEWTFKGYEFKRSNGDIFGPVFPADSPYVTSVGATQFVWNNDNTTVVDEIVASIATGSKITSGGGFSRSLKRPKYQRDSVENWVKFAAGSTAPPAWSFDRLNRGYPDIVYNGHNLLTFVSEYRTDNCSCETQAQDGSSASAPALAGMFSLVNDELLNYNQSTLGFLNPLLYKMAKESPDSFRDITMGDNKCTSFYCCRWGFSATRGWDPVSGLGSPNFLPMRDYVRKLRRIN